MMCSIAALAADFFQAREQLVLAVEAAVRVVAARSRDYRTRGSRCTRARCRSCAHERLGVALVRFGKRGRIGRDGDRVVAQRAVRRPGQIGRIRAAGEGHDHAAHRARDRRTACCSFSCNRAASSTVLPSVRHSYCLTSLLKRQRRPVRCPVPRSPESPRPPPPCRLPPG